MNDNGEKEMNHTNDKRRKRKTCKSIQEGS